MSSERTNKGQEKLHEWQNAAGESQMLSQAEGKARRKELQDGGWERVADAGDEGEVETTPEPSPEPPAV